MQSKAFDKSIQTFPTSRLLSNLFLHSFNNVYGLNDYYTLLCNQIYMQRSTSPYKKVIVLRILHIIWRKYSKYLRVCSLKCHFSLVFLYQVKLIQQFQLCLGKLHGSRNKLWLVIAFAGIPMLSFVSFIHALEQKIENLRQFCFINGLGIMNSICIVTVQ